MLLPNFSAPADNDADFSAPADDDSPTFLPPV
jgi:hypothetical protein